MKGLTPSQVQFLGRCEFCDAAHQDEDHLIRHCPAPTFVEIRSKLLSEVDDLIRTYPTSPVPCRQFARAIKDLALRHADGTSIWTGLWRDSIIDSIGAEARFGPSLSYTDSRALKKVLTEVGKCFCYATSALNHARQRTPRTSLHTQSLQDMFPEFTMYFPIHPKRCKLTRYRTKSKAERQLSLQPFNPPPPTRGLSKRQQKDRIRNHLAIHEAQRTQLMLNLAQQPALDKPRTVHNVLHPHCLRHISKSRSSTHRAKNHTRLEQAPVAPAPPAGSLITESAAPRAHITRLRINSRIVRFYFPKPAAPPREGVG